MERPNTRTIRVITLPQDWELIAQEWASRNNFRLDKESPPDTVRYHRSMGLMMAPITLEITPIENSRATLQVWMPVDPITMFTTLLSVSNEVHIDSGDGSLVMERKTARMHVNRLLEALAQPLIE